MVIIGTGQVKRPRDRCFDDDYDDDEDIVHFSGVCHSRGYGRCLEMLVYRSEAEVRGERLILHQGHGSSQNLSH